MKPIILLLCLLATGLRADPIRVMTFNLRYASGPDGANAWENANQSPERRETAVAIILAQMPDLIGFQEGEDSQLDYLAAHLPSYYHFERQRPSGGSGNENAAFAFNTNKLTLLDRGVFSLGNSPGGGYWNNLSDRNFLPWDLFPELNFAFPRIALWGQFRWRATDQEILFYSTHFDTYNSANSGESQVKSATLLADDALARTAQRPASPLAIMVGDFNGSQNDRAWQLLTGDYTNDGVTGDFRDAWYDIHGSWNNAGTFHGFAGGIQSAAARIDWILHRGNFSATASDLITTSFSSTNLSTFATHTMYPSDHYPVTATLDLPAPALDTDRDGLPDALEWGASPGSPALPDSDGDLLLDGQEDLNGNGVIEGGETDPVQPTIPAQLPTDIRTHQMDGIRDFQATRFAVNGLELFLHFDGRYLYAATQDAGEGNDHILFVVLDPNDAVAAPLGKSGQVARPIAMLMDENDNDFASWFDENQTQLTNRISARAVTYFQNGGSLEGVIDLASILGTGLTNRLYLAVAPYATADGGGLISGSQVPAGNGDANILGAAEYVELNPGDADGDGINDWADPDRDGDGLPDAWESSHGLDPNDATGDHGADGDLDGDGASNFHELSAGTSPSDPSSHFAISMDLQATNVEVRWPSTLGSTSTVWRTESLASPWAPVHTTTIQTAFPQGTNTFLDSLPLGVSNAFYRIELKIR